MPLFMNLRAVTSNHTTAVQRLFDKPTVSPAYSIIPVPSPRLTLAAPAVLGSGIHMLHPAMMVDGGRKGRRGVRPRAGL
jgi:hypothetical protein